MKCKFCKKEFEKKYFNQKYCLLNYDCISAFNLYAKELNEKKAKKDWQQRKKKLKADLMTVQDWVKVAQTHFNNYIRKRDKGQVCISCQKPPRKENAGHFFNANNHWNVRFDEDNVHLQCEACNTFLSGNLIEYRANLINKIGLERFEALEQKARLTRKFTVDELKEIIEEFKNKVVV